MIVSSKPARDIREHDWDRLKEAKQAGLERFIVNRSSHPGFYVSSWPVPYGHTTLRGKEVYRLPHLQYNSVLVVAISNEWCEGSWWRVQQMLAHTEEQGFTIAFEEMDDMSLLPTDAIGIMRACGALMALDAGFEWCFLIDTDILPEPDLLVRLLQHDRPVLYPLLHAKEDLYPWAPLSSPVLKPGMGLQTVQWAAMSAMLFNTHVFNCLDAYAWHGHDRHFAQCLNHFGHRIYVDTDTVLEVARGPSRHPSKSWDELWAGLKRAYERRQGQDRDRRPPPDWNPAFGKGVVDRDGVYWAIDKWKYGGVRGAMTDQMVDQYEADRDRYYARQEGNGDGKDPLD